MIALKECLNKFWFFSDSAVANLYPYQDLSKILQILNSMHCSGPDFDVDMQMADLFMKNAMESAGIEEQYFNHLGFHSSVANHHSNFVLDSYRSISHFNDVNCQTDDPFSWLYDAQGSFY